ncbi:MAG: hypothetical protein AUJ39_00585 [Parcubacteria group bacterium CG1_02_42_13]|nr:MAG: hypothetical protein AUJ39_00585 [Parcubacteria group bacterium CG1_02_42_13]
MPRSKPKALLWGPPDLSAEVSTQAERSVSAARSAAFNRSFVQNRFELRSVIATIYTNPQRGIFTIFYPVRDKPLQAAAAVP